MKNISFFLNIKHGIYLLTCIFVGILLKNCYSFTGGTIPEYLKTLYISTVNDNSGFGNPNYRNNLTQLLVDKFRNDNSYTLVERGGDAKLNVSITSIDDATLTVGVGGRAGGAGELENQRKITVTCEAEYYDSVKKKLIWKKTFSNFEVYDLTQNVQQSRDNAINTALEQTADDILLSVVSGW
ncbi:MAG: hypothetical protein QG635_1560 [Bacteroidota bacterium]|nr:hypothetical protein [Bacteroidota bacterium]